MIPVLESGDNKTKANEKIKRTEKEKKCTVVSGNISESPSIKIN